MKVNNSNINLKKMITKPIYIKVLEKVLKVLETIIIAIIIISIIFFGMIAIGNATSEEGETSFFGYTILRVVSGSMEDTLKIGDVILVRKINIDDLNVGDIISFENEEGTITTHRIIEISLNKGTGQKEITTKGDSNNTVDSSKVIEENIKGKYMLTIKGLGTIINFINTNIGFACIIFLPIMLLIIVIVREQKNEKKKAIRREKMYNYNINKELGETKKEDKIDNK